MKYYPAYLDLRDRSCLVVGGGAVAERKALSLLEAGAVVTVISPALTARLRELSGSGKISHREKKFSEQDLEGEFLVIAATDSPEVNTHIAHAAKSRRMLVNVAAPPEESAFIVPSVVERGDLLITISTSGSSPALSRNIRKELEARYGPEYELFLEKFAKIRKKVMEEVADEQQRRRIFQAIVDSDAVELLRNGKAHEAEVRMIELAGLRHNH